jgi:hypothetical protein
MNTSTIRGPLCAAAFLGLVLSTALRAEPATGGPWAKVPQLSTACYFADDPADARLAAADEAVKTDHAKQRAINDRIEAEKRDVDPWEQARRMQEAMMKDPQNAMKYMQSVQSMTDSMQTEYPEVLEKEQQMQTESEALMKRYQTALRQAYGPGIAQWAALKKKLGLASDAPHPGEAGVPAWAWTEWDAILREWDRAYVANCAQWWGAGGQAQGFMRRYKEWLVQERIPHDEAIDQQTAATFAMMGTGAEQYRSEAAFVGVEDYIKLAQSLWAHRMAMPRCPGGVCDRNRAIFAER